MARQQAHHHFMSPENSWERLLTLPMHKRQAAPDFRFGQSRLVPSLPRSKQLQTYPLRTAIIGNGQLKVLSPNKILGKQKVSSKKSFAPVHPVPARKRSTLPKCPSKRYEVCPLSRSSIASSRLLELAKSRRRPDSPPPEPWRLTRAMREFQPSARLLSLASRPISYGEWSDPYQVSSSEIKNKGGSRKQIDNWNSNGQKPEYQHITSERILHPAESNKKSQNKCLINPRTKTMDKVNYQRLSNLAKPKQRDDYWNRESPFNVSKRALKARITPRVMQLAKPRI